jgi:type IV fimbrial biogenesis protein FimT
MELMVSMTIAAILLALAVPAFDAVMTTSRLAAASNSLLSSLYLARSEAIKRNGRVVVCKSQDGASCASTGDWDQGWIVYSDDDNDAQVDPSETVILRVLALDGGLSARGNQNIARYVSYASIGATQLTSGAFQAGTITVCREGVSNGEGREIVISSTGRPRVEQLTVTTCP